ncbi:hypothetical protein [Roseateles depolymerans]|nr:hypothetical protein [Roseateles depolymerans]
MAMVEAAMEDVGEVVADEAPAGSVVEGPAKAVAPWTIPPGCMTADPPLEPATDKGAIRATATATLVAEDGRALDAAAPSADHTGSATALRAAMPATRPHALRILRRTTLAI